MKVVAVTYATVGFRPYAEILAVTARRAGIDRFESSSPADLPTAFVARHASILSEPRGAGYWLWKPWAIARTLDSVDDGDVVVWVDAATYFADTVSRIVTSMDEHHLDVWIMGEGRPEGEYTDRDAFVVLDADTDEMRQSPQRFASCIAFRRTPAVVDLVASWMAHAADRRVLTDDPGTCGLPDHPEFVDHRHDQSIFSVLTKQAGIPVIGSGLVREGLVARGAAVIGHPRTSVSPRRLRLHVLRHRLASPGDLMTWLRPSGRSRVRHRR